MLLVGRNRSPFTRRVAVSLRTLGFAFEQLGVSPTDAAAVVREHNPLGLVPALVLDDGATLIDSAAIVDDLDTLVGPERALTPPAGEARREVTQLVAIALQALDKVIEAHHEILKKPADKQDPAWIDTCHEKMQAGFAVLEQRVPSDGWMAEARMTQADIVTVVAFDFSDLDFPALGLRRRFPRLAAFSARLNRLPAFAETRPEAD